MVTERTLEGVLGSPEPDAEAAAVRVVRRGRDVPVLAVGGPRWNMPDLMRLVGVSWIREEGDSPMISTSESASRSAGRLGVFRGVGGTADGAGAGAFPLKTA